MKGLLFTYLLTYGGAALALFDPFVGLLVYVCFAIIRPEYLWFWAVDSGGNYSRIVGGALVVGWGVQEFLRWRRLEPNRNLFASLGGFLLRPLVSLVGLVVNWDRGEFGRGRAIVAALLATLLWSMLSATLAANEGVAWRFNDLLVKIVLPFIIGMCLLDSVNKLKILAWVIMLSQAYIGFEMNVEYLQGYNRILEDGFGGMDNNSAAIAMVTCLGLAFFLGLYSEPLWMKLVAFGAGLMLGHSVLISMSRGGMLAIVITGFVSFLLIRKKLGHYALFALAVGVGLYLAGPQVRERFLTLFASEKERDPSAASRLELWAACWDVMKRYPILGVGPDHWPLIAHEYGFNRGKEAHSLWLQFGAEIGIPGLTFLVLFYGLCVWRLWPLARGKMDVQDPWIRYLGAMVIAALVGFAVSAQFVSLKLLEVPYYVVLLGAGTLHVASRTAPQEETVYRNVLAVPGAV